MTDFTHHNPRLLSDADSAADLAGLPRPVSSENMQGLAVELQIIAGFMHDPRPRSALNRAADTIRALVSERDELAVRVRELEGERKPLTERQVVQCLISASCLGTVKMSYDSGPYEITRSSINADRLVRAVEAMHGINASKEQP